MTLDATSSSLLRARQGHEHSRVTYVELFFDLVFVFAVTQLSHALLEHLTLGGLLQTTLLLMAVWWVWIYTSWVTNWLDPERTPVRLMLFALMLAGLVLSTSIPKAFDTRGLAFAGAFVFMQVGRSLFVLRALKGHSPGNYRNFQRITCWLAVSGVFWIAGATADAGWRLGLWAVAVAIEYIGPSLRFWTPGLGASTTSDWNVEGGHLAERCGLFIIIALGESILVTGAKFGNLPWTSVAIAAFLTAFIGSVAMWWIYFNVGAERGSRHISRSSDPGRMARLAYTYIHLPLVAGIILVAVGDELVLAHPGGHTDAKTAAILLGGPALYLFGNLLFKRTTAERMALSHLVGLALLALLLPAVGIFSPLGLSAATTTVLVVVAIWETLSLRPSRSHAPAT
ncbi:MAG: low temperature requirement protein A [Hyphomonadaceae bacterium]|jgi:low temperature requirement protein LtrA|nr:low temperature requirement protein A [Hyphomonadaceae bacterium]